MNSRRKKSPTSKAWLNSPVGPRCRAAQTSRSSPRVERNGAAQQRGPTSLRREFRAGRESLPTALERDTILVPRMDRRKRGAGGGAISQSGFAGSSRRTPRRQSAPPLPAAQTFLQNVAPPRQHRSQPALHASAPLDGGVVEARAFGNGQRLTRHRPRRSQELSRRDGVDHRRLYQAGSARREAPKRFQRDPG